MVGLIIYIYIERERESERIWWRKWTSERCTPTTLVTVMYIKCNRTAGNVGKYTVWRDSQ
jgi:hypothetical protein